MRRYGRAVDPLLSSAPLRSAPLPACHGVIPFSSDIARKDLVCPPNTSPAPFVAPAADGRQGQQSARGVGCPREADAVDGVWLTARSAIVGQGWRAEAHGAPPLEYSLFISGRGPADKESNPCAAPGLTALMLIAALLPCGAAHARLENSSRNFATDRGLPSAAKGLSSCAPSCGEASSTSPSSPELSISSRMTLT